MRILVNFMARVGINIHWIAEDAKTPIGGRVDVVNDKTLIKMLRYVRADDVEIVEVETDLRRRGSGSVFIDLKSEQKNLLWISPGHASHWAYGKHFGRRVQVNERTRIARELHDALLQSFKGAAFQFQAARKLLLRNADNAMQVMLWPTYQSE